MRVLSFTTVFPNAAMPQHGLFVLERLRHCASHAEIRVVAPRPFYPWPAMQAVPREERYGPLQVLHPTFRYIPRILKSLDGFFLYAAALPTLRRLAPGYPFDLIDAHFGYPDGLAAVLLGRRFGRPVVLTLRGNEPGLAQSDPGRRRAMRFALRRASRIITVSEPLAAFARDMLAGAPGPVPPVTVIANGVDLSRFVPAPQGQARRALGLPEGRRVLVSVGHLSPRKGFQRVLRVLPDLLGAVPDLMFVIVGGAGAERNNEAELRRQAAPFGDRVLFAGTQPPERVVTWLQAADLFVLASDYEGCPNVVWEAQACGVPVVATKVGEVERMVPGHAGHLVDEPEDAPALLAALTAGLTGRHDAAAIRAWAERHDWDGVALQVQKEWAAAVRGD